MTEHFLLLKSRESQRRNTRNADLIYCWEDKSVLGKCRSEMVNIPAMY